MKNLPVFALVVLILLLGIIGLAWH